jgi:hypothetical protein
MEKKLIDLKKAAEFLGVSEEEIKKQAARGEILSYNIAGVALRFDLAQLEELKKRQAVNEIKRTEETHQEPTPPPRIKKARPETVADMGSGKITLRERLSDFFYFNDFYLLTILVSLLILWVIFITNK